MTDKPRIYNYKSLRNVVTRMRDDLRHNDGGVDFVLLYAYNGTGKTRLSMEFKDAGKRKKGIVRDTLYFNAFTEDLFHWDNDLANDANRVLQINSDSKFFDGFKELALEEKIFSYLMRYSSFNFKIDYDNWYITFSKLVKNPRFRPDAEEPETVMQDNIKISRGEENVLIWCVFLAICELVIDGSEAYDWVKYFYIDDPISSLDDNNAIAIGSDLAKLLRRSIGKVKTVISSHHSLFYNVMCNELKKQEHKSYFFYSHNGDGHSLQSTSDTPFFHHVAMLSELKKAADAGRLYASHFNILRGVMEKTSSFFGFKDFSDCIHGVEDEVLFSRALNLLSHGDYSLFDPKELTEDNKRLFNSILNGFLERYAFDLPNIRP
ncbi:AAA family ATPase [Yersinia pseudotuberculosis]|uniref:AAA family ATPase n=1 Tax=Yersinia pseudotuberculosis TaxID=633 RepID=UPI000BF10AB7|nr:AAA family ATPase [Yersinia pseudotuberculosis]AXY33856.1 anticodon nuclease [Yersinia pseudotuberculosis]MBO1560306.1 AAA family ATPase [Yersinia pseudotuberculosis]PEI13435.1 anticodon nuclease [Yersinia pseudotuberculosis]